MMTRRHLEECITLIKPSVYWALAAVIIGIVLEFSSWYSGILAAVLSVLFVPLLALGWIFIGVVVLKSASKNRFHSGISAVAVVAPILAIGVVIPAWKLISWCSDWGYFLKNRDAYQEVIRLAENGNFDMAANHFQKYESTTFRLDQGPPLRIAFLRPDFYLDGWAGIIYDPTGDVISITENDIDMGKKEVSKKNNNNFQYDLYLCSHLTDTFYKCTFKD